MIDGPMWRPSSSMKFSPAGVLERSLSQNRQPLSREILSSAISAGRSIP